MRELALEVPPDVAEAVQRMESRGRTAVVCAWDGRVRGALAVGDALRDGPKAASRSFGRSASRSSSSPATTPRAAAEVAEAVGIERFVAEARPADKREHVAALQRAGAAWPSSATASTTAPALGQADLGLALAAGTDVAVESGDAVLVSSDPRAPVAALQLARRTYRTIAQNLVWAFAYNLAAIPAAALGGLDPMIAAGAMALSSRLGGCQQPAHPSLPADGP